MGLNCAPDFVIEQVLCGIDYVEVYLDDIGVFGNTSEEHQILLDKVLSCLEANGFTINLLKCAWAIQDTDCLGYCLMPTGLKPRKKCIPAILVQESPCNIKEMCSFLGAVNTYQLMWPKRAYLLKPLSDKSGKKKSWWIPQMDNAIKIIKTIMAADVLMAFPNYNIPFCIYTDASNYQMGIKIIEQN